MPEGHSVHRIAARFRTAMTGPTVSVSSPQGRFSSGASLLDGRSLEECRAVGKQMFARFTGDLTLRVHLGLYGAWDFWEQRGEPDPAEAAASSVPPRTGISGGSMGAPRISRVRAGETESAQAGADPLRAAAAGGPAVPAVWPPPPVGAVRVRLLTDALCADLRGPTACEVLDPDETAAALARLGPDPLADGRAAGRRRFLEKAARRRTPMGTLLMDQSVVAGIGNIYRAELLFRARIDPHTPAARVGTEALTELWDDWCRLLDLGVETGVILTRRRLGPAARRRAIADEETRHYVYGRGGQPCRDCGTPVSMELMQNRKLFWCSSCQTG